MRIVLEQKDLDWILRWRRLLSKLRLGKPIYRLMVTDKEADKLLRSLARSDEEPYAENARRRLANKNKSRQGLGEDI